MSERRRICPKCLRSMTEDEAMHISDYGKIWQCDNCFEEWAKTQ